MSKKITKEQVDKVAHHIYTNEKRQGSNVSYEEVKKRTADRYRRIDHKRG